MGSGYRKLGVDGEERLSGHGVSWCATCDGFFFRDQHIAVVGGGDSALEEATFLTRFAETVTLVHRRDSLRASKIMQERAFANEKIRFAWNSEVAELVGEDKLSGVVLRDTVTGETRSIDGDRPVRRDRPRPAHRSSFGDRSRLDDEGYVLVEGRSTRTNLSGVFACGDLVDHTYRQAITAAGSGCAAALDAEHFLASLEDAETTHDPLQVLRLSNRPPAAPTSARGSRSRSVPPRTVDRPPRVRLPGRSAAWAPSRS